MHMPEAHLRDAAIRARRLAENLAPGDEARARLLDLALHYDQHAEAMARLKRSEMGQAASG